MKQNKLPYSTLQLTDKISDILSLLQMNSLRGLLRWQPQIRFSVQNCASVLTFPHRQLHISPLLQLTKNEEKHRRSVEKMTARGEIQQDVVSLDALKALDVEEENLTEDIVKETFSIFPDETTSDQLFNGIPFKDLPVVLLLLHKNNTRLFAQYADGRYIWHNTPAYHGFLNAKKRTNVAGQVAGLNMGQRLRGEADTDTDSVTRIVLQGWASGPSGSD